MQQQLYRMRWGGGGDELRLPRDPAGRPSAVEASTCEHVRSRGSFEINTNHQYFYSNTSVDLSLHKKPQQPKKSGSISLKHVCMYMCVRNMNGVLMFVGDLLDLPSRPLAPRTYIHACTAGVPRDHNPRVRSSTSPATPNDHNACSTSSA